ncbi:protein tyrosine kinase, partial [Helicosporidium sp. ATCC 50920]
STRSASFEGSVRLLDSRVVLGGLSDANGPDAASLGDIAWSDGETEPALDGPREEGAAPEEARALLPRVRPRRHLSECLDESPASSSPELEPLRAEPIPPDAFESASSAALACEEGKDDWLVEAADITLCVDEQGRKVHLGEGGFGVVVKGLLHGVDEVAVKRVRTDRPSKTQLATFHHEVHALRHLCHRNVVQFYGACLNPGNLFLVTELMGGGDLYSTLRRQPHVMAWRTLGRRVALDIALGLHYLHTRRPPVVHRDLKSPNILLTSEGVAKIADVGMSRRLVTNLVTAQPIMTPLWAAPEVLRRERTSAAADVWSLGVLVWEIATRVDITRFQPLAMARGVGGG